MKYLHRPDTAPKDALTADRNPIRTVTAPPSLLPPFLGNALFELLMVLLYLGGTVGCVITGFSLPIDPLALSVGLPLLSVLPILCGVTRKRIRIIQFIPSVVVLLWLWIRADVLYSGFLYAAAVVMRCLCSGYPGLTMPVSLSEQEQFLLQADTNPLLLSTIRAPLTEMILWLALLTALMWLLLYRRLFCIRLCIILPIPAFVLCFLIIEVTIPALWALLFILLYWIILFFTRFAVVLHPRAAAAQAAFLLIPCVLFLSAVYSWYPRQTPVGELVEDGYNRVMTAVSTLENKLSDTVYDLFSGTYFTVSAEGDEISFANLNPRRYLGRTVMRAKSDTTGVVYLREKTYGAYTDNGWEQASADRDPFFLMYSDLAVLSANILAESGISESRLSLDGARSPLLFTPYYFADASVPYQFQGDRSIINKESTADYDISFYRFSGNFGDLPGTESANMLQIMIPQYLKIDQKLSTMLRLNLSKNGIVDADQPPHYVSSGAEIKLSSDYDAIWQTVADITYFVRGCAEYSLNADVNTTGRDFVLWFLEDAEYGYCTHFATAEVMLLRACGIPARLAAGFLCSIRTPDKWTSVKDSDAHAWVEVFDPRLGWIPVEATPPTAISDDMDADRIIAGMTPIPGNDTTETEQITQDTESVTETAEQTEETQELTETAEITSPDTEEAVSDQETSPIEHGGKTPAVSYLPELLRTAGSVLAILLLLAAAVLFLLFRRRLRRTQIAALFHPEEQDRNRCALRIYRRCTALARACGEEIPAHLTVIAEKARFSQHILTQDEMDLLGTWYDEKCAQLQVSDKPLARLRHSWIDLYY